MWCLKNVVVFCLKIVKFRVWNCIWPIICPYIRIMKCGELQHFQLYHNIVSLINAQFTQSWLSIIFSNLVSFRRKFWTIDRYGSRALVSMEPSRYPNWPVLINLILSQRSYRCIIRCDQFKMWHFNSYVTILCCL